VRFSEHPRIGLTPGQHLKSIPSPQEEKEEYVKRTEEERPLRKNEASEATAAKRDNGHLY
jgi:hypothetical protein